jgi:filamentous hemagglutinin
MRPPVDGVRRDPRSIISPRDEMFYFCLGAPSDGGCRYFDGSALIQRVSGGSEDWPHPPDHNQPKNGQIFYPNDINQKSTSLAQSILRALGRALGAAIGAAFGLTGSAEGPYPIYLDDRRASHIFRNSPGHLADTEANRSLLLNVANDRGTWFPGQDVHGNIWAAAELPGQGQLWVVIRDNLIINGGMNKEPQPWNPVTGLSAPTPTHGGRP